MRNQNPNRTPKSLTDLPLNVIFRVLSYLDMEELQHIAKCCRLLRILANENLIFSNDLMDVNSRRDQWTKRLLFNVFDILNGSRNVLLKLSYEHNMSIIESVQLVQQKFELGMPAQKTIEKQGSQLLLMENEDIDFMNDIRDANEKYRIENELYSNNDSDKETLTYLKILQGFHNIARAASAKDEEDTEKEDDKQEESYDATYQAQNGVKGNASDNGHDVNSNLGTPIQSSKASFEPTIKQTRTISPTSSNYSKSSATSIFSDLPPKLSDRGWHSSIYELEHVSDHLSGSNSDGGASSSSESILRLRNSSKVKDKAALFEKLISKDYGILNNQKKSKKKKFYGALNEDQNMHDYENNSHISPSSSSSSYKRNISQGYLEELERCNLIIEETMPGPSNDVSEITDYQSCVSGNKNHVQTKTGIDLTTLVSNENDISKKLNRTKTRRLQRNRLRAFVTEDNKICYEKI